MSDIKQRILFVNSEIYPYLPETDIAKIGRYLPQGIQDHKREVRAFMPRFGCVNERKHQLHEVIRLSGMNIIISEVDRPLIIKVATIASTRIQVYFIDNEDYFRRRETFFDEKGEFFADNDERAIFFARGVLETVKKLRWAPDIIHCHGWISHLVPAYLKKAYKDDPIFSSCKIVLSLYDDTPQTPFASDFASKACLGAVTKADLALIDDKPTGINLAQMAAQYSDGIILGSENVAPELVSFCKSQGLPILSYNKQAFEEGSYSGEYCDFYDKL